MREKGSTEDKMKRKKAKILVVEDNPGIREIWREALSQEGYTVKLAQNGKGALLKVRKESFDLILTGVKMLRMNGVQLLKEVQKIVPDIKIGYHHCHSRFGSSSKGNEVGSL